MNMPAILQQLIHDAKAQLGRGEFEEAIAAVESALKIDSRIPDLWHLLGHALMGAGRDGAAVTALERARDIRSGPQVLLSLAAARARIQDFTGAISECEAALKFDANFADAHFNLAKFFYAQRESARALFHAERAHRLRPKDIESGRLYFQMGGPDSEAERFFKRVLASDPNNATVTSLLADTYRKQKKPSAAAAVYAQAAMLSPDDAGIQNRRGNRLVEIGQIEEAIEAYERSLAIDPMRPNVHSNLIQVRRYLPSISAARDLAEARRWQDRHGDPRRGLLPPPLNSRDPDRLLKIGYVSPDFRQHPVGFFMSGPLEHHAPAHFSIVCYNAGRPDDYTPGLQHPPHVWRDIRGLSDEATAALIRDDGIDILVDLAGHTASNRLALFAMKPAPVQVTAGGTTGTTGCDAIDYIITDRFESPAGSEGDFSERLVRLPANWVCYAPPDYAPPVSPPPFMANGYITFCCFNNLAKINAEVAEIWTRIVTAVPGSRLILRASFFAESESADYVRALFQAARFPADRLILGEGGDHKTFLGFYNAVDIALDAFPFSGGLTTLEALWMGAPTITLAGDTFFGRHSVSHLTNIGLIDLIGETPDRYVDIAVALARDPARLAQLRGELRGRMVASPLTDAVRYTRALEEAYRRMWRIWCAGGAPEHIQIDIDETIGGAIPQLRRS